MKIILLIVNILLALTAIAYPIIWLFFQADQLLHTLPYVMSLLWLIKSLIHPNKGQRIFALCMAGLLFLVGWQRSLDMMYWYGVFCLNILLSTLFIAFNLLEYWAIYTGVISYIIMGLVMSIEWLIRQRVKRNHYE